MNGDTCVVWWKSARETTDVRDLDTDGDEEFRAMKKRRDELWRKRDEEVRRERRDRELEEMIEEITAREAKAARAARPIKVKCFTV
jgi:hypothetical protein